MVNNQNNIWIKDRDRVPDKPPAGTGHGVIQLSSGLGPEECELAVGKLLAALQDEFPDIQVLASFSGKRANCYRSVKIASKTDLSFLEGTVKWVCQSPFRPWHKRKNWFLDISLYHQTAPIYFKKGDPQGGETDAQITSADLDSNLVRFETFRCSGKGGQHVNKVETGVRAIYLPMGLAVTATEARSQYLNKQIALNRLCDILARYNYEDEQAANSLNRLEHSRIVRGNPVRVYEGMAFIRRK